MEKVTTFSQNGGGITSFWTEDGGLYLFDSKHVLYEKFFKTNYSGEECIALQIATANGSILFYGDEIDKAYNFHKENEFGDLND